MIKFIIYLDCNGTASREIEKQEKEHSDAFKKFGWQCVDGNFTLSFDVNGFKNENRAAFTEHFMKAVVSLSKKGTISVSPYDEKAVERSGNKIEFKFNKHSFLGALNSAHFETPTNSLKHFADTLCDTLPKSSDNGIILDIGESPTTVRTDAASIIDLWEKAVSTATISIIKLWENEEKKN